MEEVKEKKPITALTLKHIMDIEEDKLDEADLDFDGLSFEQKLIKWRENVTKSVKSRQEYIEQVQQNNKEKRLELLQYTSPEGWVKIIMKCKEDPIFFFNMFLWTYNPRLAKPHVPFITYPYQDDFIKQIVSAVETGIDVWIEKSRDMGLSWVMLGIFLR